MTWYPIAFLPPQTVNLSGKPYAGAVLKAYEPETTNVIPMATSSSGETTASSFALNSAGYPVSGGMVIIPHVQQNYKLALYPNQAAADADSGAVWTVDDIPIAADVGEPYLQVLSGDGIETTFNLTENLGTDERTVIVFADQKQINQILNGDFATDTVWNKGAGWTIASGTATATGAISTALSQDASIALIENDSYNITMTITASAGSITPNIGGKAGTARNANGTYTETIIAGNTQAISFTTSSFTGTIDSVVVSSATSSRRMVLKPDEFTLDSNTITFDTPPAGDILIFAPSRLFGAVGDLVAEAAQSEANALAYKEAAEDARDAAVAARDDILTSTDFIAVADDLTGPDNIGTVASIASDVSAVAGVAADIQTLALMTDDIALAANNLPKSNKAATSNPTIDDDSSEGYTVLSQWINTANDTAFVCVDAAIGAAIWRPISTPETSADFITVDDSAFTTLAGSDVQTVLEDVDNKITNLDQEGRLLDVIYYTSSGSFTKATYPTMAFIRARGVGGGGGGCCVTGVGNMGWGGGGGYSEKKIAVADLSSSETVTIAAGGASSNSTDGTTGGTTSFGTHFTCNGGAGGDSSGVGGVGGSSTGGDVNIAGERGGGVNSDNPAYLKSGGSIMGFGGVYTSPTTGAPSGYGAGGTADIPAPNTNDGTQGLIIVEVYS